MVGSRAADRLRVLSLVFTIKLHPDIPAHGRKRQHARGVKEVASSLVFFAVFLFLIQNSFDLMTSLYEVVGLGYAGRRTSSAPAARWTLAKVSIVTTDDDAAAPVAMLVVSLVSWLVVLVAYI